MNTFSQQKKCYTFSELYPKSKTIDQREEPTERANGPTRNQCSVGPPVSALAARPGGTRPARRTPHENRTSVYRKDRPYHSARIVPGSLERAMRRLLISPSTSRLYVTAHQPSAHHTRPHRLTTRRTSFDTALLLHDASSTLIESFTRPPISP